MASPELQGWLEQVIDGTGSQRIKWKPANPTTYIWEVPPPKNGRVSLQRVERVENYAVRPGQIAQRKIVHYVLQVYDLSKPQQPAVAVNGAEDADANTQLEKLFQQVSSEAYRENLDFLKSLLP